jgi:hypothetical protein
VANFEEAIQAVENLNAGKTFPALSCKN